ncbi:hypothetical protein [Brevundimonas sp. NIBR11]|uniref:hypothetical protein n=1 Tax=Brevundimonas sp. NIBR11 TaxID=3015999 RepID=UPI0022F138AE|nr:hypothetical protein [Brevundimonas sp. NIBR11]
MSALAAMTILVAAITVLFPETGLAKSLNCWLVEAPARWLTRTAVWRILFYGGLIAAGIAMTLLFEAEGMMIYGFMAPEIAAWAVMFDVGMLIDALLITAAVLAASGLKVAKAQVGALTRRAVAAVTTRLAGRAPRPRHQGRLRRKPADDDRPAWGPQPAYRAFSMA